MTVTSEKARAIRPARPLGVATRRSSGFTLIELMVAVAIVGILAGIAYPSYMDHVRKGNRAAAQAFMMEAAGAQQRYLMNNRSYASDLATLGYSLPSDVSGKYTASFTVTSSPPAFTLTLTPVAGSVQADDGSLCLANTGARTRRCEGASPEAW
jgi:type IV pilus assembly protein PilE